MKEKLIRANGVEFTDSNYHLDGKPGATYPTNQELREKNNIPKEIATEIVYRDAIVKLMTINNEHVATFNETKYKTLKDQNGRYYDSPSDYLGAPVPPFGGQG